MLRIAEIQLIATSSGKLWSQRNHGILGYHLLRQKRIDGQRHPHWRLNPHCKPNEIPVSIEYHFILIISYYIIVYYVILVYYIILYYITYIYMLICIYPHQLANSPHFWDQPPICLSDCRTGLPQVLQWWWTSLSLGATWDWPVSIRCVSKNSHDISKLSRLISTSIRIFMAWSSIFCWWPSGNLT